MKKRILKGLGLGLVIVFLFGFEVIRAEGDLEKYICRNINTSIKIDGHLNDCAWNKAGKVYLNVINCPASRQTTWFKLLWDKKYLYVGFHCKDTDIWSSQKRRDADLYIEEVVEIFLDPDSDGKTYIELEVNPRNAVLDLFVIFGTFQRWPLLLREWNALGIRTMVKISGTLNERRDKDNYWEIEIAIPLTNFATDPNGINPPIDELILK